MGWAHTLLYISRARYAEENPNAGYCGLSFSDPLSRFITALVLSQEENFKNANDYRLVPENFQKYALSFHDAVNDIERINADASELMKFSKIELFKFLFETVKKHTRNVLVFRNVKRIYITGLERALVPFEVIIGGLDCLRSELPEVERNKLDKFKYYPSKVYQNKDDLKKS